jgi:hypothetical protein
MRHLFAPIPWVHLASALDTFERERKVALGSNQLEQFEALRQPTPTTVWLCISTGYVPNGHVANANIGKVVQRGRLIGAEMGDRRGKFHPESLRPESTGDDSAWTFFYVVTDLEALDPPIASASLIREGGGRIDAAPHQLVWVKDPLPKARS